MPIPPPPQTGRQPISMTLRQIEAALRARHAGDARDPFATDPHPEVRQLGRLALRRKDAGESVSDYFALGDLCAGLSLGEGDRLRIFYVGKALIAYDRAYQQAQNDVDRTLAARAYDQFVAWVVEAAREAPTRKNIAVALWALADDTEDEAVHVNLPTENDHSISELLEAYRVHQRLALRVTQELASGLPEVTYTSGVQSGSGSDPTLTDHEQGVLPAADMPTRTEAQYTAAEAPVDVQTLSDATLADDGSYGYIDSLMSLDSESVSGASLANLTPNDASLIDTDEEDEADEEVLLDEPERTIRPGAVDPARLTDFDRQAEALTRFDDDNPRGYDSLFDDELIVSQSESRALGDLPRRAQRFDVPPPSPIPASGETSTPDTPRVLPGEYEIGQIIDGRYEVADVRRGGMGVVYLCYDRETHEPVALKSFQSKFLENQRAVLRFEQEALTWIRLEKHRHIVQARLVQRIASRPHILLEHISGPEGLEADLRSWIERKRLTLPLAVEFGLHIALGMHHATQRVPGLVHRDLKPANILVTQDNVAKVTDFGLVRSLDSDDAVLVPEDEDEKPTERLTRAGAIIGTIPYMAPEQWVTRDVDARADIYAFGCLLYEMIAGRHIFRARRFDEWMQAHREETPIIDPALEPSLPHPLRLLILNCLQKQIAARPSSWEEIVEQMAAIYKMIVGHPAEMEITGPELAARELMDKGYSLTELRRYDEALQAYDRALSLQPKNAYAWARKGRTLRLAEQYAQALECYEQSIGLYPGYASSWRGKGIVLEKIGRIEEALACYQQATTLSPDDPWSWYDHANALIALGRQDEAFTSLQKALQLDDRHANSWAKMGQLLRQTGKFRESVEAYQKALHIDPTYAWAHNGCGLTYKAMGELRSASICFRSAVRYQPDDLWIRYNLTEVLVDLGLYDEAVDSARLIIKKNPDHALAWAKLGQALRYLKRSEEALVAYNRAIALQPGYTWAINGRGIVLEQLGRLEEAWQAYMQAAQTAGADVWTWYNVGNVLSLMNRHEEAIEALEHALTIDPTHARTWARLGATYRVLGRMEDAVNAFNMALENEPDYAWAWKELGIAYERTGRLEDALHAYQRAGDSAPEYASYVIQQAEALVALGELEQALTLLDQALRIDNHKATTWAKRGQVLRRLGQLEEALRSYSRAVELDPNYGWAWNGRALVLSMLGRHEDALAAHKRAIELDRTDVWNWYNYGEALINVARFRDAADTLEQAVRINPRHAESWGKLGQAYRRLQRPDDAVRAYDAALAINPQYAWAWHGRGLALEMLGRREEAQACFERALEHDDSVIWYFTSLVDVLLDLRRSSEALSVIDRAVERLPDNATAWARRGQIQRRLHDYANAVESYRRAVTLDPTYAWAWNGLGLAYVAINQPDEATSAYEQAVRYNPNDIWFWHNYGDAWLALGDCERALLIFEQALRLDPAHEPTLRKLKIARDCLDGGA